MNIREVNTDLSKRISLFITIICNPLTRCEILDWYHLSENLYKVGGSQKRLKKAESFLWEGKIDEAIALFTDCRPKTCP